MAILATTMLVPATRATAWRSWPPRVDPCDASNRNTRWLQHLCQHTRTQVRAQPASSPHTTFTVRIFGVDDHSPHRIALPL
uniref:Secreted protein n=1 Tax=Arundo donax TaxID=35708 RepID=A0A0A9BCZ0_ARUDO